MIAVDELAGLARKYSEQLYAAESEGIALRRSVSTLTDLVERAVGMLEASSDVAARRGWARSLRDDLTRALMATAPTNDPPPEATERPILFSAPMVRALLAGRKTQTRRVVRPQPRPHHYLQPMWGTSPPPNPVEFGDKHLWREVGPDYPDDERDDRRCPYGAPGDRLWCRETWGLHAYHDETDWFRGSIRGCQEIQTRHELALRADWGPMQEGCFWRPAIFMPRWASRITLEVTEVRVQRIQQISEDDARSEGVRELPLQEGQPGAWWTGNVEAGTDLHGRDPVAAFRKLWDSINDNGSAAWSSNPWVWAVTFRRVAGARRAHAVELERQRRAVPR